MIWVTGDTHADFSRFNTKNFPEQKEMTRNDHVIICGDFGGVWMESKEQTYWLDWLAKKNFTICFVDGNHENFELLSTYPLVDFHGGKAHMIRENVYHLMRGDVFIFENQKFFAFGGAASHDIDGGIFEPDDITGIKQAMKGFKSFRVNHVSWWKEEQPSEEEMQHGIDTLEKNGWMVDYVITHDLPLNVMKARWPFMERTITNSYFDRLIDAGLKFTKWYGGHHHVDESIFGKFIINYEKLYRIF